MTIRTSTLHAPRSARRLAALGLLLLGCDQASSDPDPRPGTSSATGSGETASGATGSGATGSGNDSEPSPGTTSGPADDTADPPGDDTAELYDCQEPQAVPPAPVDCSAAQAVLRGSVILEEGDDPSVLEGVRRVEGSIRINRLDVTNLDFMACVQEVGGDVTIFGNDQLTDVDGLWSLQQIGTDFVLSENGALVDFDGLPNVITIPRNLVIKNNDALQGLSGFEQLTEVGDNLLVQANPALRSVDGLGGLRTVGNVLAITANAALCISSVNCVGLGITDPAVPPPSWSAQANDDEC